MRFFNTAGPVHCKKHYCLPPLERLDLNQVLTLIQQEKYFVLHAPRQTGKTSSLLALMEHLNREGTYRCLYVNVEMAQSAREDVRRGIKAILSELGLMAQTTLADPFPEQIRDQALETSGPDAALNRVLTLWAQRSAKPLILLVDEVDALVGDTLISVLRQLRSGYANRPASFPQSIVLCGVRDVRDYRIHSSRDKAIITGGSAFNVKAESLRLGDFRQSEMEALYGQHTEETGQRFEDGALALAWDLTRGQPWLVNALSYEACFKMREGQDRAQPVTAEMMAEAKERLILRRETHLDQLIDKLQEPRVRRVIEPMLRGENLDRNVRQDDIQYVMDLGLIRRDETGLRIANATYREVIPRELSFVVQLDFESLYRPAWYVTPDGRLDMGKLMAAFQDFFRQHAEHWIERFEYREAGPQLLLQAFLQRIVNGGGRVEREYGLGRRRTDMLVWWPVIRQAQDAIPEKRREPVERLQLPIQRVVIELKVLHNSLERTVEQGLEQTWAYMDRCGADEGHLVVFDRDLARAWESKIFCRQQVYREKPITVWGM